MISPVFLAANAKPARKTVVIVNIHERGKGLVADHTWAMGTYGGRPPTVAGISVIASGFDYATLRYRVGEVTARILTTQRIGLYGERLPGPVEQPENYSSAPDARREMDVIYGFGGIPITEFLEIFRGLVTRHRLSANEFEFEATDGMDVFQRMNVKTFLDSIPDLWTTPKAGLNVSHAIELTLQQAIRASTGNPADRLWGITETPEGDAFETLLYGPTEFLPLLDYSLMLNVMAKQFIESGRMERAQQWLASIGGWLRRDARNLYIAAELRPQDKAPNEQPSGTPFRPIPEAVVDADLADIGPGVIDTFSRIRKLTIRCGLMVWDVFDDYEDASPGYGSRNPKLGTYQLEQVFELHPATANTVGQHELEGRELVIDVPWLFPTEGGGAQSERLSGEASMPLFSYDDPDPMGFPALYRFARREWQDHDAWTAPVYEQRDAHNCLDMTRVMYNYAARILRASALTFQDVPLTLQSRVGATIGMGDQVRLRSRHVANPTYNRIGFDRPGEDAVGVVVGRTFDAEAGTVSLMLRVPVRNREGDGFDWQFTHRDEVCYAADTNLIDQQYAYPWRQLTGGVTPGSVRPQDIFHRMTFGVEGENPRANDDPLYGPRFHYFRYRLVFALGVIGTPSPYIAWVWKYRVSILIRRPRVGGGIETAILYSIRKRFAHFETERPSIVDSISPMGCPGFEPDRSEVLIASGAARIVITALDTSIECFFDTDTVMGGDYVEINDPQVSPGGDPRGLRARVLENALDDWLVVTAFGPGVVDQTMTFVEIVRKTSAGFSSDVGIVRPHLYHEEETIDGIVRPPVHGLHIVVEKVHEVSPTSGGLSGGDWEGSDNRLNHGASFIAMSRVEFHRSNFGLVRPGGGPIPGHEEESRVD